jgi:hypothetical protein
MGCSNSHVILFPDRPCLVPTYNYRWLLCNELRVSVDGIPITIPKGFVTDLASIPKILWSFDSPFKYSTILPAILHDFLYTHPGKHSRFEIDAMFYSALIANGASKLLSKTYFMAVRLFGGLHFNKKRNLDGFKNFS